VLFFIPKCAALPSFALITCRKGVDLADENIPSEPLKLTALSHGAGCGCKLGPALLDRILKMLPTITDTRVLVGTEDDAGVYKLSDDIAVVQTVDFFTPIVDDPYDFGAIAASNALSDIYAMGARPLTALNLVAFPKDGPADVLGAIMRGGVEKTQEAGVSIIGGHSIDDKEPKYGMAVMGVVHPDKIIQKNQVKEGDRLILTKPLGIGIISTAIKTGRASAQMIATATRNMKMLNREASEAMVEAGVKGATDITGFGLLGHLHEMLHRSSVSGKLTLSGVPFILGVRELAKSYVPGGTRANLRYVNDKIVWGAGISEDEKLLLADAQTSGGLLIAVSADKLDRLLSGLAARGVETRSVIGEVVHGEAGKINVTR
jgi:selenide,water dikinase